MADVIDFPDENRRALRAARRLLAERLFGQIAAGDAEAAKATLEAHLRAEAESDEARTLEREAVLTEVRRLLDEGLIADAASKLNALTSKPTAVEIISGAGIFAPLPPTNWLVEGLEMAPGAPSLWAGFGFGGKSYAAQALAISVASGTRAWGTEGLPCRQGRVLHLDFEQGKQLTLRRYQKLARGLGLTPDEIGDRLAVAPLPAMSLAAPDSERWLTEQCNDTALCIIDSFRAACPEVDENSSESRRPLDALNRVSEATGCTFLVLHHARKPSATDTGGAKMAIRGSSGLYDACASVVVFEGKKGQPTTLKHEKARITGKTQEDFAVEIRDVQDGYGNWDGVEVVMTAAPGEGSAKPDGAARAEETSRIQAAILAVLEAHPEGLSGHAIREEVGGNRDRVLGNLDLLVSSGRVEFSTGRRNAKIHRLARPVGSTAEVP